MAASSAPNPLSLSCPSQISKDELGPDNPIPLSPQWLLPKPGENKAAMAQGEYHMSSDSYGDGADALKSPGSGEEMHKGQKKKDVFRPTFLDMESGRRDRWRDEERDTNPLIRRDCWREGDKDIGDNRKTDPWGNNSSVRPFGEARRVASDRWADPNRENNYDQRRESKWNPRWGPDGREGRELDKWADVGKHGDMPHEKAMAHLANHGKDEKEGDHYRPWRPSSLQNRGRAEPPHHQSQLTGKESVTFGHGRGRGEISSSTFSVGRGRSTFGAGSANYSSANSQSAGFTSNRGDNGVGEPSPFRYSRTKLLDIYRLTDLRSSDKILDGLLQFPSLSQDEPLEPLVLCAPSSEESAILKGIDKGDIVSSGIPQVSKDGSGPRSSVNYPPSQRTKLGSRDDVSLPDDSDDNNVDNSKNTHSELFDGSSLEKQVDTYGSNATMKSMQNVHAYAQNKYSSEEARDDSSAVKKVDEGSNNRDCSAKGGIPAQSGSPWRSHSVGERLHPPSQEWSGVQSRSSDIGWSQGLKDPSNEGENGSSRAHNERKWQIGDYSVIKSQPHMIGGRENEARKLLQPAPEDLLLYYKDPQGQVQGPFSGNDIIGWFEAGYFGIDLLVRVANAPNDAPFSLLGDVMPHLRAKSGPPPGFNTAKQNEAPEVSGRSSLTGFGKVLPGPNEINLILNEHRLPHGSSIEAENRFLESFMSGDFSNAPLQRFTSTEGVQGFKGHTSSSVPTLGAASGDALNLLATRMNLERQKSSSQPYPFWPVRDAAPVAPNPDILRDSSISQADPLSTIADVPRQAHLQNVEMMSILQGLSDRSSAGMNSGVGGWPNFSVQGGLDPFKDKLEVHHGQNIAQALYGMQQQKMQPQNQPSIPNLLPQTLDSSSNHMEKLLSSGLVQDPQMLNLLQQQYLMQLQSQQSMSGPQPSLLDKILLLKQQQKQEEQQLLMQEQQLLMQQQQQLLSQVLSEQHLAQRFGDPSFGQLRPSAMPNGNVPTDQSVPQPMHQLFQNSSQVPISGAADDRNINFSSMPPQGSQDLSNTFALENPSLRLPHQMFEEPKNWPMMTANNDNSKHLDSSSGSVMKNLSGSKVMETSQKDDISEPPTSECSVQPSIPQVLLNSSKTSEHSSRAVHGICTDSSELPKASVCEPSRGNEDEALVPGGTNDGKVMTTVSSQETPVKEGSAEVSTVNEAKSMEAREVKKNSEKKSRKQKSSKSQVSSDLVVKEASKASTLQQSKQPEADGACGVNKPLIPASAVVTSGRISVQKPSDVSHPLKTDSVTSNIRDGGVGSELKSEHEQSDYVTPQSKQVTAAHGAWKPAVSVKPKSLLEIQQEEQQRPKMEIPVSGISLSVASMTLTASSGVSEPEMSTEVHQHSGKSESNMGVSESKIKKSELHDLLAQEVLAKSNEKDIELSHIAYSLPALPTMSAQLETLDDDNFIEAKDTKKSRKKAAKAKSGSKASVSSSADVMAASSPIEKGKTSRHIQAVKVVLPAPSSGPSLGDFVPWTGESTSPSPSPAWSTDPVKLPKPTSLRDILKEQEKRVAGQQQSQIAPKSQPAQPRASLWSVSASPPSKAAVPVQNHSHVSSQSKCKGEDDLFWGTPDQSKQDNKKVDFPQLGNQVSRATKSTPSKGVSAPTLGRLKSAGGRSVEHSSPLPVPAQSWVKGKIDGGNKHSEAMDFRDWCESESVRLTGSKDTSFLEFCLKQSTSEAETLLIENLESFDPNHEFIEKFLNYMELLPADVLDMAFQSRNDQKAYRTGARDMTSDCVGFGDTERDNGVGTDSSSKGGKKKGKKGKKVSPSVLGFNVVSNRIMMGEIQALED